MIVAGLDVAFSNDFMALVIIEEGNDGKIRLRNLDTWRKIDWHLWKEAMREKQSKFNIDWIYVDQTNNQSVVMELQYLGMRVEGVSFTNSAKNDMIRNATKLMVTGELIMPEIERIYSPKQQKMVRELYLQLEEQEYQHDTVHPKLTHPSNRHDDLLWALCLALYGIKTNNTGVSIVMGASLDDYKEKSPRENVIDNVLRRFSGSEITVTDVKVTLPEKRNVY
jgi:hypothetical protein